VFEWELVFDMAINEYLHIDEHTRSASIINCTRLKGIFRTSLVSLSH